MRYIASQKLQKKCLKNLKEIRGISVKIFADLQLSLRSSGTIFTDPQGC